MKCEICGDLATYKFQAWEAILGGKCVRTVYLCKACYINDNYKDENGKIKFV